MLGKSDYFNCKVTPKDLKVYIRPFYIDSVGNEVTIKYFSLGNIKE